MQGLAWLRWDQWGKHTGEFRGWGRQASLGTGPSPAFIKGFKQSWTAGCPEGAQSVGGRVSCPRKQKGGHETPLAGQRKTGGPGGFSGHVPDPGEPPSFILLSCVRPEGTQALPSLLPSLHPVSVTCPRRSLPCPQPAG